MHSVIISKKLPKEEWIEKQKFWNWKDSDGLSHEGSKSRATGWMKGS